MATIKSIEEKAKAYDEAVINGSRLWECGEITRENYEYIFPELKESEDEKIRKSLINHFRCVAKNGDTVWTNLDYDKVITWLEKQGEQKYTHRDIDDAYLKGIADVKREVKKIDEQTEKMKKEIAEFIFNSKEDIKQRYEWIKCLGFDVKFSNEDKQSEQKPAEKVEPKFHEGDWVVSPNGVYWHIDAIQNGRYEVTADTGQCGNWPLDTNLYHLWTIQDAKDGDVLFTSSTASHETFIFKNIDEKGNAKCYFAYDSEDGFREGKYHFIGRATDCKPATKEQRDLLFSKMKEAGYEWDAEKKKLKKIEQKSVEPTDLRTWKYIVDAVLTEREGIGQYLDSPVTEEVAKKLQKRFGNIEQKPVELEKEEKSRLMKKCVHRAYQQGYNTGFHMATTELEHKQEWSEEDEKMYNVVHDLAWESYKTSRQLDIPTFGIINDWLKSLKDRYTWKPSEEQIKTLEYYMHALQANEHKEVLFGLMEQLKAL